MTEKKELSQLGRQLLGGSQAIELFTQEEFDKALAEAYEEVIVWSKEAVKMAILMEREECAKLVDASYETTIPNDPISADWLLTLAEQIRNRIPIQKQ